MLGHAAADAGAVNLRDVDVVLLRDPADERRRLLTTDVVVARAASGGWRGCRAAAASRPLRLRRRRNFRCCAWSGAVGLDWRRWPWRARRPALRTARPSRTLADRRDDAVHRNGLAFLDLDLGQHAGGRRRNLRVDLVGGDLEQRLVAIDRVADLLDPADDRAFGDRLAHLGHHDGCGHRFELRLRASTIGYM